MKRTIKVLKIALLVVGILIAAGLIANVVLIRTSGARLEERLTELRADGQPTSLSDLTPKPVAAEENAAVLLRRVKDQLLAMQKELADAKVDSRLFTPDEEQSKVMRSAFEAYPQVVPALVEAANCTHYDSQLDYTLGFHDFLARMISVQDSRAVYRVLSGHILLLTKDGQYDDALRECIALLELTRHFDDEPAIISHLVSLASRSVGIHSANVVLQSGEVSAESRLALEAELALHDNSESYKHALRTERAMGLSSYREIGPWSQNWLLRSYWNREVCLYLDLFSSEIVAADMPYSQAPPVGIAQSKSHPVVANIVPAIQAAREANTRTRAHLRSLRVLNAIQSLPEAPQEPPDLSKLGLPAEATTDPFNNLPLVVKKLPAGWLVYSVGKNLKDDGGDLAKFEDVGVGTEEASK